MFTGLVTDMGRVGAIEDRNGIRRLSIRSRNYRAEHIQLGASIQHSGVCLTVVDVGPDDEGAWWDVEAIPETLSRTTVGSWQVDTFVNIEPSLKIGDELGGHLVYGHVDGLGSVKSITPDGASRRIRVALPGDLGRYLAEKGSISVDGVSLTVSAVGRDADGDWFEVAIIPHTWQVTTLGLLKAGDKVNLEVDMLARYVARMLEWRPK
jgi:riboflavin synthase